MDAKTEKNMNAIRGRYSKYYGNGQVNNDILDVFSALSASEKQVAKLNSALLAKITIADPAVVDRVHELEDQVAELAVKLKWAERIEAAARNLQSDKRIVHYNWTEAMTELNKALAASGEGEEG
jgi:hypothetical protein